MTRPAGQYGRKKPAVRMRLHMSLIRQHTSAYVRVRQHTPEYVSKRKKPAVRVRLHMSHIRRHTSAYASIRQHTSAYVSIRQHTPAYATYLHTVCGDRACLRRQPRLQQQQVSQ
jgi:hypothetical protein